MNDDESEVAGDALAAERGIGAGEIEFSICHQVFYDLAEIEADTRLYPEAYAQTDAEECAWNECFGGIFQCVRGIGKFDVKQPVMIGPFWLLVDDGI